MILSEVGLMFYLRESSVVWLLVVMILVSCVVHCTLMLAFVIFHSTDGLNLSGNSLMGTIPTEIALLSNLGESSIVLFACCNDCVVMCVFHCLLVISFYRYVGSLGQ
jgi:hypothetical protein